MKPNACRRLCPAGDKRYIAKSAAAACAFCETVSPPVFESNRQVGRQGDRFVFGGFSNDLLRAGAIADEQVDLVAIESDQYR
jgi:hypothetical protein